MHLRSSQILSRQPASPRASCFCHLNSGTQCGQNASELPKPKLSTSQNITDKNKKRERIRGENRPRSRPTLTLPKAAKSTAQLTNISMGITQTNQLHTKKIHKPIKSRGPGQQHQILLYLPCVTDPPTHSSPVTQCTMPTETCGTRKRLLSLSCQGQDRTTEQF